MKDVKFTNEEKTFLRKVYKVAKQEIAKLDDFKKQGVLPYGLTQEKFDDIYEKTKNDIKIMEGYLK